MTPGQLGVLAAVHNRVQGGDDSDAHAGASVPTQAGQAATGTVADLLNFAAAQTPPPVA